VNAPDPHRPLASTAPSHAERLLPTLTSAQMARIEARGRRRRITRGEILVELGDHDVPFFVVVSGEVQALRPTGATEILIVAHGPGQFSGVASILPKKIEELRPFRTSCSGRAGDVQSRSVREHCGPSCESSGPRAGRDRVSFVQRAEADDAFRMLVFTSADAHYFISHVDVTRVNALTLNASIRMLRLALVLVRLHDPEGRPSNEMMRVACWALGPSVAETIFESAHCCHPPPSER
jgi:hypothetical protein